MYIGIKRGKKLYWRLNYSKDQSRTFIIFYTDKLDGMADIRWTGGITNDI